MVTTFYPPYHFGGDAVFVYRLVQLLAALGHRVDVIHSVDAYRLKHPAEPEIAFEHHPNVTLHRLRSRWPLPTSLISHQLGGPGLYRRRIRKILEQGDYDVIHFHNISLMGGPGVLRLGRAPKLYTSHEYWLICPTHVLFAFEREACVNRKCIRCTLHSRRPLQLWRHTGLVRRCLRHVNCLIAPSDFAAAQLKAQGVETRIEVIPHFVPLPGASPGLSRASHSGRSRPYFLFVGRLEKLKGVQDLISIFRRYSAADLLIVGNGDYAPELRQQAAGMDHIEFLGAVHSGEIGALYRGATAVLVPSLCYETFGLIAVEAFAQGTPVISRRIGALAETVEKSGAGCVFETPDQCREHMERLCAEPALRAALGEKARQAVERFWTPEVHLDRYFSLVRSLIAERHVTT